MPTTGFWALVWLKELKLSEIYGFLELQMKMSAIQRAAGLK